MGRSLPQTPGREAEQRIEKENRADMKREKNFPAQGFYNIRSGGRAVALFLAMLFLLAGCGKTIARDSLTRPPLLKLTAVHKEAGEMPLNAGSHSWNYRISKEEGGGSNGDSLHPLDENNTWETMVLAASASGSEQYKVSIEWIVKEIEEKTDEVYWPDQLTVAGYDEKDIGNTGAEPVESVSCERKELEEESFLLHLHPGRIYQITLSWDEKGYKDNGFYGSASYVFRTVTTEPEQE